MILTLEAIDLIDKAWTCVTSRTIANCYRHCGYSKNQQTELTVENDEFLGLDRLFFEKFSFSFYAYAKVDNNLSSSGLCSDQEIIDDIIGVETDKVLSEDEEESIVEAISTAAASNHLSQIKLYLEQR
jgi:hypothetical protein